MNKLENIKIPNYTHGEEVFNTVTHIVGGGFGIIALIASVALSITKNDPWAIASCCIYGISMILVYTISSIYHGLKPSSAKKVLRILDHCTIYLLIAGTYTPIVLCAIRQVSPIWAWTIFGIVWGCAAVGLSLTAIDMKRFNALSMVCYLGMGWCIVIAGKTAMQAISFDGLMWLLAGGIAYTLGAVLYGLGKKIRYMHSIFHLFVVAGSVLQFICILFYII